MSDPPVVSQPGVAASPDLPPPGPGGSRALTLNRGSSSIKFAVYAAGDPPVRLLAGEVAKMLPIPRRFEAMGVRRYGFHRQEDL